MKMKNKYQIINDILVVYNKKDNQEILFDINDYDLITQTSWYIHGGRYATASSGQFRKMSAHRLLLNNPVDKQVDHINNNKLDNRKQNLRIVTPQQNSQNNKKVKGYYWNKKAKKWHTQIAVYGKNKHIGMYDTEKEARQAYLEAKKIYHPSVPVTYYE